MTDRMLSEQLTGCVGMRMSAPDKVVDALQITLKRVQGLRELLDAG